MRRNAVDVRTRVQLANAMLRDDCAHGHRSCGSPPSDEHNKRENPATLALAATLRSRALRCRLSRAFAVGDSGMAGEDGDLGGLFWFPVCNGGSAGTAGGRAGRALNSGDERTTSGSSELDESDMAPVPVLSSLQGGRSGTTGHRVFHPHATPSGDCRLRATAVEEEAFCPVTALTGSHSAKFTRGYRATSSVCVCARNPMQRTLALVKPCSFPRGVAALQAAAQQRGLSIARRRTLVRSSDALAVCGASLCRGGDCVHALVWS